MSDHHIRNQMSALTGANESVAAEKNNALWEYISVLTFLCSVFRFYDPGKAKVCYFTVQGLRD